MKRLSILITVLFIFSTAANSMNVVSYILPQVYESGSKVRVIVVGKNLEDPQEVLFYSKGFKATGFKPLSQTPDIGGVPFRNGKREPGQLFEMTIHVDKQVKPGEYFFRLRTAREFSEMVSFWVTQYPIIEESHKDKKNRNNSPEYAQEVTLNHTVVGYLNEIAHQDHDWYKVKLKKGQRLSVQALAMRLGTYHYGNMNDTALEIFDPKMKKLAFNVQM